jgi:hypothetical protein
MYLHIVPFKSCVSCVEPAALICGHQFTTRVELFVNCSINQRRIPSLQCAVLVVEGPGASRAGDLALRFCLRRSSLRPEMAWKSQVKWPIESSTRIISTLGLIFISSTGILTTDGMKMRCPVQSQTSKPIIPRLSSFKLSVL